MYVYSLYIYTHTPKKIVREGHQLVCIQTASKRCCVTSKKYLMLFDISLNILFKNKEFRGKEERKKEREK